MVKGFGLHFGFLPEGGDWPCDGEIDIMEQGHTGASSNVTTGAAHLGNCPYDAGQHQYVSDATTNPESLQMIFMFMVFNGVLIIYLGLLMMKWSFK